MRTRREAEIYWEKKLNIATGAGEYDHEDSHHARYQPTDYAVLERMAASGYICGKDTVVDYGCGKGRVGFFLNYVLGCSTVGVEYDEAVYQAACANLVSYAGRGKRDAGVSFVCTPAERYAVQDANAFYFFNPFSLRILQAVVSRILESYYIRPRPMQLFFYYLLDDHLTWLMTQSELSFAAEIDCRDLYHNADPKEKILVFTIG